MRTLLLLGLLCTSTTILAEERPPEIEPTIVVSQADDGMHLSYRVANRGRTPVRLPRVFSEGGPVRLVALSPAGVRYHRHQGNSGPVEHMDIAPGETATIEEAPIRFLMSEIKAFNDYGPAFGAKPGDVLVVRLVVLGVESAPLHLRFDPDKIRW